MNHGERNKKPTPMVKRDFLALRDEWYQRLKDEGFNDIETDSNPSKTMTLKTWDSFKFSRLKSDFNDKTHRQWNNITMETTQIYFTKLEQSTSRISFVNDQERDIWEHFTQGVSVDAIAKKFKITFYRADRTVRTFLRRLKYDQPKD